ncbi:Golgi resident protein GCP60 [Lamellibrachia satsuma]|nr:Golgi resident protein GCP60 [Lamellibrachia satsuma]
MFQVHGPASEWHAWLALGDLSKEEAMVGFIEHIDQFCPMFKAYIQAHRAEKEEQERRRLEEEEQRKREEEERERCRLEEEVKQQQAMERQKQAQQEQQIRAALNQQTSVQFRQYALQQYPGSPEQQEILIRQLQEQHFQQYMQQVYQQQLLHQQQQRTQLQSMSGTTAVAATTASMQSDTKLQHNGDINNTTDDDDDAVNNQNELPPVAAASMWTRKDITHFKDSLRKDPDSIIKVGSGETVTVRVPTHEDGTCLFWEFASDSFDLGFGVYFEWTIAPTNQVSVHVSESSDEDELDEDEGVAAKGDVEKGSGKEIKQPPTDEIIPVYRRDCHEEVYCGSHMYPGQGVYLLKFDNSYSLWRSKTLYYRVYYTR